MIIVTRHKTTPYVNIADCYREITAFVNSQHARRIPSYVQIISEDHAIFAEKPFSVQFAVTWHATYALPEET